ncbi:glutathione s-transferase [Tribonema minus]|uniref:Glutathione s-transferase n=1 Tax=Tribonema minus TaxID=303371 RepID=A0A835YSJ4_9STRA|nr:glutathione s-transferase [Tribonema minus]
MSGAGSPQCSLEIYGNPGSRSPLINWYLAEIKQPFVNMDVRTVPGAAAKNPHPFGQIPALRDDDDGMPVELFESGAILNYLADKYGGLDTPGKRAARGKWVVWANASLDPVVFKETPEGRVRDTGLRANPPVRAIANLERMLGAREWLVDDAFSVADVAVGAYLLYALMFFGGTDLSFLPNIAAYMARCARRPAYVEAFGQGPADALATACEGFARKK